MTETDHGALAPAEGRLPDVSQETALERLQHAPVISHINEGALALIARQVAPDCTRGEIGHFLELCARYDLDPFAREAWCAKSKRTGKLLIMVGRDGLRKIAQRNGLHVDGDVVHQNDEFSVCRTPDGNRTVAHSYGQPSERGEIVGAWAEVREGGPMGRPMGYFFAALAEYKPDKASEYSPWVKQTSVMNLAAAERQAVRQATPLSGLLAVGEDETIFDAEAEVVTTPIGDGSAPDVDLPPAVLEVCLRAEQVGHKALADQASVAMMVGGQSADWVAEWVRRTTRDLDAFEAQLARQEPDDREPELDHPPDAEVLSEWEDNRSLAAFEAGELRPEVVVTATADEVAELRDRLFQIRNEPEPTPDEMTEAVQIEERLRDIGADVAGQEQML